MEEVNVLVIGDPHFTHKNLTDSETFSKRCLTVVKERSPDFVVLLGDILDTHEIAREAPFNLALKLIENIAKICPIYVLMGNHDLINHVQFLTSHHFFNAHKHIPNVHIIDKPRCENFGELSFTFCPYVAPGRFTEALNTLLESFDKDEDEGADWTMSSCIFAHQEFAGVKMGAVISEEGDVWEDCNPLVVSGHIHESQTLSENIFYTGSAMQHAFGSEDRKYIWMFKFREGEDHEKEPIDLGIKGKRTVKCAVSEIEKINSEIIEKDHVRLVLNGTNEEFKSFRRTKKYEELVESGFKFAFRPSEKQKTKNSKNSGLSKLSYEDILKTLVSKGSSEMKMAYQEILNE